MKKWSAQDDATLQRMATEGNSLLMIAAELGRTPMAVLLRTRLLSGLESPTSKRRMDDGYYDQTKTITQVAAEYGRKWSREDGEMLQKRFLDGWNIFQLARHFNRTPNAIVRQLQKMYSRAEDMEALFDHAKYFFGKKRVVRKQNDEKTNLDEGHNLTLAEQRRMVNDEVINQLSHIIQDFDNQITDLQKAMESDEDYGDDTDDPNIELEKELISKRIPESATFQEAIGHLNAVIGYIGNTLLDSKASMLIEIELLKARRQLVVQSRDRRLGLIDAYAPDV